MRTDYKIRYLFLGLVLLLTLQISCTPESCLEETQTYVKATFYTNDGTGKIKAPDTLTIYGVGRENKLIYNKVTQTSSVLLPLDASSESCDFIFIINNKRETVSFKYTSYPHFVSKECGYTYFNKLDSVMPGTFNIIDAIYLDNKNVIIPNEDNIRIFY